jgi:two-component system response regulator HydG
MRGRVLIVDDDEAMCDLLDADLRRRGFEVVANTSAEEAFLCLKDSDVDTVLSDLQMPGMTGLELCTRVVSNRPDVPFVAITAFGSMETAVSSLRAGAFDFVTKPIDLDLLEFVLDRAIRHRRLQRRVELLEKASEPVSSFGSLVGESAVMRRLYGDLERLKDTDTSVLIVGESGTGKELVARALHHESRRSSRPFLAINCAALPETLLESELFGHVRGAFTDARTERKGLFLEANGGTLFLDEIGDLPLALQPKLLRVLEQRAVRPVGGSEEIPFDVRLIAATNRDLEAAIEEGRFRDDLFFRVNVVQIRVPPLRSRGMDVLLLAQKFLEEIASKMGKAVTGMSEAVAERLVSYPWPGNVRELRNALERAVTLTRYDRLSMEDMPDRIRSYRSSHVIVGGENPDELIPMEEVEKRYIEHVLNAAGGNKTLAAKILGFDRKTLYRKLQRLEADK